MTTTQPTTAQAATSVEERSILTRFAARTRRTTRKTFATGSFVVL